MAPSRANTVFLKYMCYLRLSREVDGAFARNRFDHLSTFRPLADFARPPTRLAALQVDDQALDLRRQLVGIAHRPPRAVGQSEQAVLSVPTAATAASGQYPGAFTTSLNAT
jgi:hypothetical protein